jgi:hypothetical protein
MTWQYERAENGNVALTAEIDLAAAKEGLFVLAIGFGTNPAEAEFLRRYIVLHMKPILSNTQASELNVFRIWPYSCQIKYGDL